MKYIITILFCLLTTLTVKSQNCLQMDIVLLADASGSVGANTQYISNALKAFADRFETSENGVRIGIVSFGDKPLLLTNITHNKNKLKIAAANYTNFYSLVGASTKTADALMYSTNLFYESDRPEVKKLIILITDGEPNDIHETTRVADEIRNLHNIDICTIHVMTISGGNKTHLQDISSEACYVVSGYESLIETIINMDVCL
jgi:Mg-chelatase subunit ChlD